MNEMSKPVGNSLLVV